MFLSRRTVQTYVPHILAGLGAKSRVGGRLRSAASGHLPIAVARETRKQEPRSLQGVVR